MTFWKRRSKAPSFSIELRYSLRVVAPIHCITPLAKAGFRMLAASMLPCALPAPTMVWISSMKTMMSGDSSNSRMSPLIRSSNCPRNLVPATMAVISSSTTRLLKSSPDTCCLSMSCASPSTMALLPTPGSPINIGLFFLRRPKISITRSISLLRPTTGSSLPSEAAWVRS